MLSQSESIHQITGENGPISGCRTNKSKNICVTTTLSADGHFFHTHTHTHVKNWPKYVTEGKSLVTRKKNR